MRRSPAGPYAEWLKMTILAAGSGAWIDLGQAVAAGGRPLASRNGSQVSKASNPAIAYRAEGRETACAEGHDAPGAIPDSRADLSQRGNVAASAPRRGGLRLVAAGALPAHRQGLRTRQARHGLLRRPQLHLRHLYRLAGAGGPPRHPGAPTRTPPPPPPLGPGPPPKR